MVAHRASQRLTPVPFVLAGLPSLPSKLAAAKSYSERLFRFRHVGELDEEAARAALIVPARDEGVEWGAHALARVGRRCRPTPADQQAIESGSQKLTDKGLVYAPEHGTIAFTVPGTAAFIARQH